MKSIEPIIAAILIVAIRWKFPAKPVYLAYHDWYSTEVPPKLNQGWSCMFYPYGAQCRPVQVEGASEIATAWKAFRWRPRNLKNNP